ncbi:MAG: hypothetical protein WED34_01985 [Planctomycetales bacterium]
MPEGRGRRGPQHAAEFLAELEADPEYQARRAELDKRHAARVAELAEAEKPLVEELRVAGFDIDSASDFINNDPHPVLPRRFIGEYHDAYPILMRHLRLPHHPAVREGIIRALTVRDGGRLLEQALLDEFAIETDPHLRWVLANALRTAMPYHRRRKFPEIKAVFEGTGQ